MFKIAYLAAWAMIVTIGVVQTAAICLFVIDPELKYVQSFMN